MTAPYGTIDVTSRVDFSSEVITKTGTGAATIGVQDKAPLDTQGGTPMRNECWMCK